MSAADDLKHGGVFRAAGVVQIGTPAQKARLYMSDARGYADGAEVTRLAYLRRMAEEREQARECAARSIVCAVEALIVWGLS